jgi:hypothetical protein
MLACTACISPHVGPSTRRWPSSRPEPHANSIHVKPSTTQRISSEGGKGAYGSVIWRLTLTVAPFLSVTVAL